MSQTEWVEHVRSLVLYRRMKNEFGDLPTSALRVNVKDEVKGMELTQCAPPGFLYPRV